MGGFSLHTGILPVEPTDLRVPVIDQTRDIFLRKLPKIPKAKKA
jgi:hypothetical protein